MLCPQTPAGGEYPPRPPFASLYSDPAYGRVCISGIFSRLQGGRLHIIILYSSTFYKKGHVIRRNLKIPNARVSRFVDWCAVMTLESFSCVFCQSKEFDRVTDWLKHSLQAIVVYVKYLFMFQNDYKRLSHSVICIALTIDCCMSIENSNDMSHRDQKWILSI